MWAHPTHFRAIVRDSAIAPAVSVAFLALVLRLEVLSAEDFSVMHGRDRSGLASGARSTLPLRCIRG
jgi:hypothetical protein